jgi:hypothetical protein
VDPYSPTNGEKGTGVLDTRVVGRNEHHIADDSGQAEAHHEETSLLGLISQVTSEDCCNASSDVWGNAHELGLRGGVTHGFDNGGQEE